MLKLIVIKRRGTLSTTAKFNQSIWFSVLLSGPKVLKLNPERQIPPACELYMSNPNLRSSRLLKTDSTTPITKRALETRIDCKKD
jgi:hypothetical protein